MALGIQTDNMAADSVRFSMRDLETMTTVTAQNFVWTFSENNIPLFSAEAADLRVDKAALQACHTYQAKAEYLDCGVSTSISVDYTADGEGCVTPTPTPPVDPPPVYPPPLPAPPGLQPSGNACNDGSTTNNPNFQYSVAKYCSADIDVNAPAATQQTQYSQCRSSGIDLTLQSAYQISIKPGQYMALEIVLPHHYANQNKAICGFSMVGEVSPGWGCGGDPAAVDTWALSPNPGDFNPSGANCVSHTSSGGMRGRVRSNPDIEVGACKMDPGRKYYLNLKMASSCTDPAGCSFLLLSMRPNYSGDRVVVGGQNYIRDINCNLIPE